MLKGIYPGAYDCILASYKTMWALILTGRYFDTMTVAADPAKWFLSFEVTFSGLRLKLLHQLLVFRGVFRPDAQTTF